MWTNHTAQKEKKARSDITGITHTALQAQRHFFLCVSVERSAFRGTREEERGCYGGGGEEVKTRGIRIYSMYNLSPPQTHLLLFFSHRLSNCCSLMFLHWHSSFFMSVTCSPPQSFCLPLTIRHSYSFFQSKKIWAHHKSLPSSVFLCSLWQIFYVSQTPSILSGPALRTEWCCAGY